MPKRPTRDQLLLRFFPELNEQAKTGGGESAAAIGIRACEAVLADLIDLYDAGLQSAGAGVLALRLQEGGQSSVYLTAEDINADLSIAERFSDSPTADFLRDVVEALATHNPDKAALVLLIDNSRSQVLPIAREYPASSINAMMQEAVK